MNNYEVLFVLDSSLDEDQRNVAIDRVKEIISAEGEVGDVDIWGLRKLAYPIQKKNEGFYVVAQFKADATLPLELDRRLKISDDYIRHMIVAKNEKEVANTFRPSPSDVYVPEETEPVEPEEVVEAEAVESAESVDAVETAEEAVTEVSEETAAEEVVETAEETAEEAEVVEEAEEATEAVETAEEETAE